MTRFFSHRHIRVWYGISCIGAVIFLIIGGAHSVDANPTPTPASTATSSDVQAKIDQQNQELKIIQSQILDNQKKLQDIQSKKQTASSQLQQVNTEVQQINLGIQASSVTIDKLGYQMQSLQKTLDNTQQSIQQKEATIGSLLRTMQQKDGESLLLSLIRDKTLSEGILTLQSASDLNKNLVASIGDLQSLQNNLHTTLSAAQQTKDQKQLQYENFTNRKVIAAQLQQEKAQAYQATKQTESVYQASLNALQQRQLNIALEIEKMEASLRTKINYKDLPQKLPGLLIKPVDGVLTQGYGSTDFAKGAYRGHWHNGIDLAAPIGTPIFAAADGVVVAAANQDAYCPHGAYGKYVAIEHPMGLATIYGHMSLYVVHKGDQVTQGQLIGYVGKTGYATGPHVHFGVYDLKTFYIGPSSSCGPDMPFGGDLNPLNYLVL